MRSREGKQTVTPTRGTGDDGTVASGGVESGPVVQAAGMGSRGGVDEGVDFAPLPPASPLAENSDDEQNPTGEGADIMKMGQGAEEGTEEKKDEEDEVASVDELDTDEDEAFEVLMKETRARLAMDPNKEGQEGDSGAVVPAETKGAGGEASGAANSAESDVKPVRKRRKRVVWSTERRITLINAYVRSKGANPNRKVAWTKVVGIFNQIYPDAPITVKVGKTAFSRMKTAWEQEKTQSKPTGTSEVPTLQYAHAMEQAMAAESVVTSDMLIGSNLTVEGLDEAFKTFMAADNRRGERQKKIMAAQSGRERTKSATLTPKKRISPRKLVEDSLALQRQSRQDMREHNEEGMLMMKRQLDIMQEFAKVHSMAETRKRKRDERKERQRQRKRKRKRKRKRQKRKEKRKRLLALVGEEGRAVAAALLSSSSSSSSSAASTTASASLSDAV